MESQTRESSPITESPPPPTPPAATWQIQPTCKPSIIYVLGAPGAGKGTLCKLLASSSTNIYHFSVGDHLRNLYKMEAKGRPKDSIGSMHNLDFEHHMPYQKLIPAKDIVAITSYALNKIVQDFAAKGAQMPVILVDGFPRTLESAKLADQKRGEPAMVLWFDCDRTTAEGRFLQRQRSVEDNQEVFDKRYDEYAENQPELLAHYWERIVQVGTKKGTGETWTKMQMDVVEELQKLGEVETDS